MTHAELRAAELCTLYGEANAFHRTLVEFPIWLAGAPDDAAH